MSEKATPELDGLNLVIRARHGSLEERERIAFNQALTTSATLRVAHAIGTEFDRESRAQAGDAELIERALTGALATRPLRRRRLSLGVALVAATLVVASAAAAARGVLARYVAFRPAVSRTGAAAQRSAPSARAPLPPAPSDAASPAPALSAISPEINVGSKRQPELRPARESVPAVTAPQNTAATAASIFREAGAARRDGELARARSLYLELVARFPDSPEASVARVSLGKLLLSSGRAREAEAAFAAYLRSGAAALREEALAGRADALLSLGRATDERSVRQELLSRYPSSVYASRARERIAEIDGADGATAK